MGKQCFGHVKQASWQEVYGPDNEPWTKKQACPCLLREPPELILNGTRTRSTWQGGQAAVLLVQRLTCAQLPSAQLLGMQVESTHQRFKMEQRWLT